MMHDLKSANDRMWITLTRCPVKRAEAIIAKLKDHGISTRIPDKFSSILTYSMADLREEQLMLRVQVRTIDQDQAKRVLGEL